MSATLKIRRKYKTRPYRYTDEQKAEAIAYAEKPGKTNAMAGRKFKISPSAIAGWRADKRKAADAKPVSKLATIERMREVLRDLEAAKQLVADAQAEFNELKASL